MLNKLPQISVLTCCYNASAFVEEAIKSILCQTYSDFEYLLVDDGSTDSTLSIMERYADMDRRIVIIKKDHTGLTDSLNLGLRQAKGEWIARLDADDMAMPDRLSNQLNFVINNNKVVLLGGGCIEVNNNGNFIKKHSYPQEHNALMNRLEKTKAFFPHSSAFFDKQYILKLGGYNRRFLRSQDRDLWLRIGETARISCLKIPVIKLRKHSHILSNTGGGRLQLIMGVCATVCHFRRKWGFSDPSQNGEINWERFLVWLSKRIEEKGLSQLTQVRKTLRDMWYSDIQANRLEKYKSILREFSQNPFARKLLWGQFKMGSIALKLAEESTVIR